MFDNFKGTLRLTRLALRRDRIKLSLWVVFIILLNLAMLPSLQEAYGSPEERAVYQATMSTSMVARMFGGLLDGPSMGAILMVEAFLFIAVLVAFMSAQAVLRHTRFNEESGSAELMQSASIGRYSSLGAALLTVFAANTIIVVASAMAMQQNSLVTPEGAWLYNIAIGCIGMCFAGVAAVAAQLSDSAKTANLLAGAAIGVAFIFRGIGDAFAKTPASGGEVNSMWLSWLSPIGWGQQTYPFTRQHWLVVLVMAVFTVAMVAVAFLLLRHRDAGSGIFPQRLGRARAKQSLLSITGLTWRLHRTTFISWAIIIAIIACTIGFMTDQFKEIMLSSDVMRQYLAFSGTNQNEMIRAYQAMMVTFSMIIAVAFVVQVLQRLRLEETNGYLESVFATGASRTRWVVSYILFTLGGAVALCVIFGTVFGFSIMAVGEGEWPILGEMVRASLAYLPAIAIYIGLIVAAFGVTPSLTSVIAWSAFILTLIISQLGSLFRLPDAVKSLSPFEHIPASPTEAITAQPLLVMSLISCVLLVLGVLAFKRRNLASS